jgi:hypothetical protein
LIDQCAEAFARADMAQGVSSLVTLIHELPLVDLPQPGAMILQSCIEQFERHGPARSENILLALHILQSGW